MNRYLFPVKREIWEYRSALVTMPKIVIMIAAVALVIAAFMGRNITEKMQYSYFYESTEYSVSSDGATVRHFEFRDKPVGEVEQEKYQQMNVSGNSEEDQLHQIGYVIGVIPYVFAWAIMAIIMVNYSLTCLSTDRKDGSILFWKSLPVSETQSVLAKLFTALLVIPTIAWLMAVALSLVLFGVAALFAVISQVDGALTFVWQQQMLFSSAWRGIGGFLAAALWLSPVIAWLMLASAAAKRTPFLIATIPLLVLFCLEYLLFGTQVLFTGVVHSLVGMFPQRDELILLTPGWPALAQVLLSVEFWLGLILASICIALAIWFRENRYESQ